MPVRRITLAEKFGKKAKTGDEKLIKRALELEAIIEPAQKELKEIKQAFLDKYGEEKSEKRIASLFGTAIIKVANSYSLLTEKVGALRKVFKLDFDQFVTEDITYKPTAKLRKLLSDADYKHSAKVRAAFELKRSTGVVFEGISKN